MRVLLDTATLLWATLTPKALSRRAKKLIEDDGNSIYVSAASAWEIATKVRIGKLALAEQLEADFVDYMDEAGYTLLPIEVEASLRAGRMTGAHGDPFDRMIAAQALIMDIPVISPDAKLDGFGVQRIW